MKRLAFLLAAALVAGSVLAAPAAPTASAEDNGVERTPVLGWSSWSFLRADPTAANIEAQAQALHDSGLEAIGYQYVNLDDFWYQCPGDQGPDVDANGLWVTDPTRFPPRGNENGIAVVADHVHALGLKFGIYVTPGISAQAVAQHSRIAGTPYTADQIADPSVTDNNYNCGGMVGIDYRKPGAQAYADSWADRLASWGVDYVKFDGLTDANTADIKAWSKALRQTGRPIVLDITQGDFDTKITPTLMRYANQWEFAPDIECYDCEQGSNSYPLTSWNDVKSRFDYVAQWQPYAGPGGFNDYDSIEVGNGANDGTTPVERQTQMSLWALGASVFILGVDLTHLDSADLAYLRNTDVLAVDQDSIAAKRVVNTHTRQVFAKTEPNGDVIVGLFNTGDTTQVVSVADRKLGLSAGHHRLHDLWTHQAGSSSGHTVSASVPAHGVALYRITD
ncbi:MAG TPA: glycoside hydrolase family 27 protein [Pseudonocardiaceae bacterium]|nr:glycoside hydrolase family 27 protein [Pseudonocardiaceae bacterium]